MAKSQNKTAPTAVSVNEFLETWVTDEVKRQDSRVLIEIFSEQTSCPPVMWGPSIIGFGTYHYKYATGREGDAPLAGFSPRKDSIALYFSPKFPTREELLAKLGKHKSAVSCVYVKRLADVDLDVVRQMNEESIKETLRVYPPK